MGVGRWLSLRSGLILEGSLRLDPPAEAPGTRAAANANRSRGGEKNKPNASGVLSALQSGTVRAGFAAAPRSAGAPRIRTRRVRVCFVTAIGRFFMRHRK